MACRGAVIVLGVDTAASACAAALWRDGKVLARASQPMVRGHAEALMPMIDTLVRDAGIAVAAVDLFGVTIGPGAFTGLRIGLAACGGMALAVGRPIVGISSLEAVAHGVPAEARAGRAIMVVLDSKRADFYAQTFAEDFTETAPPACVAADGLPAIRPEGPLVIAGDAAAAARMALGPETKDITLAATGPADPAVIAALAASCADRATADPPAPLYLRPPDATPAPPPRPIIG